MDKQLKMFPVEAAEEVRLELRELREFVTKSSRGLFARHTELARIYIEMMERVDAYETEIKALKRLIDELHHHG